MKMFVAFLIVQLARADESVAFYLKLCVFTAPKIDERPAAMVVDNDVAFEDQLLLRVSLAWIRGHHCKSDNIAISAFEPLLNRVVPDFAQSAIWQVDFPGAIAFQTCDYIAGNHRMFGAAFDTVRLVDTIMDIAAAQGEFLGTVNVNRMRSAGFADAGEFTVLD